MSYLITSQSKPTFPDQLRVLETGDQRTSASFWQSSNNGAIGVLDDRTHFVNRKSAGLGAPGWAPLAMAPLTSSRFRFEDNIAPSNLDLIVFNQNSIDANGDDNGVLVFQIGPIATGSFTQVRARVHGNISAAATPAALPENRPTLTVIATNRKTSSGSIVAGPVTDTSSTPSGFGTYHTITANVTGSATFHSSSRDYFVKISGIGGTYATGSQFAVFAVEAKFA